MNIDKKYGIAFLAYGVACLITALVLSMNVGDSISQSFSPKGGKFGPIEVVEENEVVNIAVSQHVKDRNWSYVEGEVVDSNDNYLFSFSEELWFETGRDSDGYWEEGKRSYDISITFPKPGKYFLNFTSENNRSSGVGDIRVKAMKEIGSNVAFLWLGCISLILGGAILHFSGALKELY